ncbi:siderophore-interacting protein [Actinospongicola halichondriae]|uniref:siderophore-interacting protein n=1 Tax=Actinospongicola halichondriae TaxID=3236844 RepID=UPI003D437CB8
MTPSGTPASPIRREPPTFRRAAVIRAEHLTPHMRRIVLGGEEFDGLVIDEPASSVRLLLPPTDGGELLLPTWTGNQFELADGSRAPIRTFTPRHFDAAARELTIDVVLHEGGAASAWAASAEAGGQVAVSGPGRGYEIDTSAGSYLLAGDETAIPAIAQLLETLPEHTKTQVIIEVTTPDAQLALPDHPRSNAQWRVLDDGAVPGSALVEAVTSLVEIPPAVWVAGEAAAVQKIRKHLFDERGMTRSAATVRGYWKRGRSAT